MKIENNMMCSALFKSNNSLIKNEQNTSAKKENKNSSNTDDVDNKNNKIYSGILKGNEKVTYILEDGNLKPLVHTYNFSRYIFLKSIYNINSVVDKKILEDFYV